MRGCDIFCGAGGSSAGARAAGIEMVAGVDMCATATATYTANFPDAHVVTSRLEDIDIHSFKERVGEIHILLASPECRNHSCAKGSAPRDETSRATAMRVIDYARALGSRWLVLENVIYMRPWSRYGELKGRLRDLGYHLEERTLDASDFGVAQKRRRLFLVGDREGPPKLTLRKRPGRRKSVRSILDATGTWKTSPLFNSTRAEATLERAKHAFDALGERRVFSGLLSRDGARGWQPLSASPFARLLRLIASGSSSTTARVRSAMLQVPGNSSAPWASGMISSCHVVTRPRRIRFWVTAYARR